MLKVKKWIYHVYCAIIIFFYLIFSFNFKIFNDYPWHIYAGKWMLENKQILHNNIFTWLYPDDKFVFTHEWLSEVIMAFILKITGSDYLVFIFLFLPAIISILYVIKKDFESKDFFAFIFITSLILMVYFSCLRARPLFFGLLFFVILTKVLDDIKNNRDKKLFILFPLLCILWTNMHGGTIIFAVVGPIGYLICSFLNFEYGKIYCNKQTNVQRKKYIYLIVANFLATLVNPNGIKMFYYSFVINSSAHKSLVNEFSPAVINWTNCFLTIALISLFLMFFDKKFEFTDIAGLLSFILLTFVYGRFYSWLGIYFLVVFTKYFNDKNSKFFEEIIGIELILLLISLIGLTVFMCYSNKIPNANNLISEEMIDTLNEIKPKRLCNTYNSGGSLLFYDIKPFAFGLAELYTEKDNMFSKCILTCSNDEYSYYKYNFDYFFIERKSLMYCHLKNNPDKYELIIEDDDRAKGLQEYAIFKVLDWQEKEYDKNNYVSDYKIYLKNCGINIQD